jgi:hypothetical protein
MKRFLGIALLAAVAGLGTPAAFADGSAESPGIKVTQTNSTTLSADEASTDYDGSAESPGYMETVIIYLDVLI